MKNRSALRVTSYQDAKREKANGEQFHTAGTFGRLGTQSKCPAVVFKVSSGGRTRTLSAAVLVSVDVVTQTQAELVSVNVFNRRILRNGARAAVAAINWRGIGCVDGTG